MEKYDPKTIEPKWHKKWAESEIYKDYSRGKNFYALDMFPYPSGAGLHVGHPKGYIATDVFARFKMLQGYSVLHPMGWDAFGLPAENYAIEHKVYPEAAVRENIQTFKTQLEKFGFTYDWDREINTTDPEYYKWTQWIFLKMFEKGLAYESDEPINWCPSCKTGLALEDLENGLCERCGTQVVQKKMRQWVLKMTDYANRLLEDLDKEKLDWEESIVEQQKNWIGKSEGATIKFEIKISNSDGISNFQFPISKQIPNSNDKNSKLFIEVYTTRADTIFGCTYCVVGPEHPVIEKLKDKIENYPDVEKYIIKAQNKTFLERTDLQKEKTGIELKGIKVINPFNDEEVPLFVADYVIGHYGTGAVMAVPAHDERDFEFATKYGLPIKQIIANNLSDYDTTIQALKVLQIIYNDAKKNNLIFWLLGGLAIPFYSKVIYRKHNDLDLIVKNTEDHKKLAKLLERLGFEKAGERKLSDKLSVYEYKNKQGVSIDIGIDLKEFGLRDEDFEKEVKSFGSFESLVLSRRFINALKQYYLENREKEKDKLDSLYLSGRVLVEDGFLVNSGKYSSLTSEKAREEMTKWLEEKGIGQKKVNYKMRDWVFSRQRYWGEPIPIIHCEKCGTVGVPEKDLPVRLPKVEKYEPTGTGEGPLANIPEWVNTTCPKCGGPARRETNTMPQWAGSSWYYLRYIDPKNDEALVDKQKEKEWMPVDLYVGGAEHATRHLLYARFWHKFLYDIGVVSTKEPFQRLMYVGLINGEDGRKMSKRWGNVINPDDVIEKFGADSIRLYEMFMGPFTQNIAWSTKGVIGMRRFLEKVWKIYPERVVEDEVKLRGSELSFALRHENLADRQKERGRLDIEIINKSLNKAIKKVTEDMENFRFNTAISELMIFIKNVENFGISKKKLEKFLIILAPFTPHVAEEIWQEKLGHEKSIFLEKWPEYDPKLARDEEITLIIQINGRVRDQIKVPAGVKEDEAKDLALAREKVIKYVENKKIKKTIFVKDRLINFVI